MTELRADRPLAVIVLAAGKGSRLGGGEDLPPKPLLDCLGLPILEHVRRALAPLDAEHSVIVTGHRAAEVEAWLEGAWGGATAVLQEPQNGTGHATRLALESLPDFAGDVLVVNGDVPQLASPDLAELLAVHRSQDASATVLSGVVPEPAMLGRIVRDGQGRLARIVEARDATPEELALQEFNTGIYAFDAAALRPALAGLTSTNEQAEEYVTDAIAAIKAAGGRVEAVCSPEGGALLGVNDWTDLAEAVATLRARIATEHLRRGVRITDPATTVIEADVAIEPGARILPFTHIGTGCRIGAGAKVGPFARLRGGTVLEPGAEIGNFVEVKGSRVGSGAKAKHLTYLGDADVGPGANVGCGVITANYDGIRKHRTTIGQGASIGSGTVLVAPVEVGAGGRTGANAVVLPGDGVPPGATVVGVPSRVLPSEDDSGEDAAGQGRPEEQAGESTQS